MSAPPVPDNEHDSHSDEQLMRLLQSLPPLYEFLDNHPYSPDPQLPGLWRKAQYMNAILDIPFNDPRASLHAALALLLADTDLLDPFIIALQNETGVRGLKHMSRAVLQQQATEAQKLLFRHGVKLLEEDIKRLVA